MAVAVDNSTSYESGSGGFAATHTISSFQCNGTNSHLIVGGFQRVITTEVTSVTADGNTMARRGSAENTNVCGVEAFDYTISNASFNIVGNTPTFKLFAMSANALSGVDQSTPTTGTPVTATSFSSTMTASYTGTSGNLLLVFINCQGAQTLTASNCTQIHNFDHADANLGQCFAGYTTATGSSQTIGVTSGAADNYALTIVEIKAASGGSPPTVVRSAIIL